MVWRADLLDLWDGGGGVGRGGEGAVWGGRVLQLMVGMGMMGLLAVVGGRPGGGGTQGGDATAATAATAAAARLCLSAAALLPLAILQQRHLRRQREGERRCQLSGAGGLTVQAGDHHVIHTDTGPRVTMHHITSSTKTVPRDGQTDCMHHTEY